MPYYDVGCYECGTRMSVFLPCQLPRPEVRSLPLAGWVDQGKP